MATLAGTLTFKAIRKSIEERRRREASCPSFFDHTSCPDGYLEWHAWAARKNRTHRAIKCVGCGLFKVWVPRRQRSR